jgi:hypothetical protein
MARRESADVSALLAELTAGSVGARPGPKGPGSFCCSSALRPASNGLGIIDWQRLNPGVS